MSVEAFVDVTVVGYIGFSVSFGIDQKWRGDNLFHAAEATPLTKLPSKEAPQVAPVIRASESKGRY
jgi:hypothetical protein